MFNQELFSWAVDLFSQFSGMTYQEVLQALVENNEAITSSIQYLMMFGG